jgi:galactose mutarotase-like enzyme
MLELAHGDVAVSIVPERGAIVSSVRVGGRELLYMDAATLANPTQNVRGGIPILFPFCGKLADETFALTGTRMKQHGFGRNKAWTVSERAAGWARMTLAADADTRAQWPYEFTAEHTVTVVPGGVQLELAIVARDAALPVSPGWHPYLTIAAADKAKVRGDVPQFSADRLGDDREFDFGISAPPDGRATFELPGTGRVRLGFSPEMKHLQLWSQPGKPFICLEPFHGPANTVNTDGRYWVPPNQARTFWMRLQLL